MVCGDCSPLDTLLGSGTRLVEFWRFASLIFANQADLPSNRRCDLRLGKLHSVRWKPCRDELLSARRRRCHGLWGVAECGLNAQCLRGKRFLRVNSCCSKRRFEGIWTDVSCIFMHF